ncbi:MAG: hypothetical protein P8L39_17520 [Halioglobus sp.]|nr:hypothetical protein [Halioglobus sp.]
MSGPQFGLTGTNCIRDLQAAASNYRIDAVDQWPRVLDISRCHLQDSLLSRLRVAEVNYLGFKPFAPAEHKIAPESDVGYFGEDANT